MLLIVLTLIALGFTGCYGIGNPKLAGTHSFSGCTDCAVPVYEAPPIGAWLPGAAEIVEAQISPDGQWLFVEFGGQGPYLRDASAAATAAGRVEIDVRVGSYCFFVCNAVAYVGATRIRFDPPLDPAHPPAFFSDGQSVDLKPWQP